MTDIASHRTVSAIHDEREYVRRIELPSRFDIHEVPNFERAFHSVDLRGIKQLVIDARAVRHLDNTAIRTLRRLPSSSRLDGLSVVIYSSTAVLVAFELVPREHHGTEATLNLAAA